MQFGESWKERRTREQQWLHERLNGKVWFAWYPVQCHCLRWVWLEKVKVTWGIYKDIHTPTLRMDAGSKLYFIIEEGE